MDEGLSAACELAHEWAAADLTELSFDLMYRDGRCQRIYRHHTRLLSITIKTIWRPFRGQTMSSLRPCHVCVFLLRQIVCQRRFALNTIIYVRLILRYWRVSASFRGVRKIMHFWSLQRACVCVCVLWSLEMVIKRIFVSYDFRIRGDGCGEGKKHGIYQSTIERVRECCANAKECHKHVRLGAKYLSYQTWKWYAVRLNSRGRH